MFSLPTLACALLVIVLATVPWHYPKERGTFREADVPRLAAGKNCVVTGANSGLGYATVEHLYRAGTTGTVIMACRSMERCERARGEIMSSPEPSQVRLEIARLDLADRESIRSFAHSANEILAEPDQEDVPPIHVLMLNAGQMGTHGKVKHDPIETHIDVNHLGHFLLTSLLFRNLKVGQGRVCTLGSVFALVDTRSTDGWYHDDTSKTFGSLSDMLSSLTYYARSKRANMQFAAELERRYHGTVSAVSAHPGCTRTDLQRKGWKWSIMPKWFVTWFQNHEILCMSASVGSKIQLRAAIDTESIAGGSFLGPYGWAIGRPVAVTESMATEVTFYDRLTAFTRHYYPFSREDTNDLWEQSMKALGLEEFGKFDYRPEVEPVANTEHE